MQHQPTTAQPAILANAPRCGARTRSGTACKSPAIHGRARCRMHGGAKGAARRAAIAMAGNMACAPPGSGRSAAICAPPIRVSLTCPHPSPFTRQRPRPVRKIQNRTSNPMHPGFLTGTGCFRASRSAFAPHGKRPAPRGAGRCLWPRRQTAGASSSPALSPTWRVTYISTASAQNSARLPTSSAKSSSWSRT